MTSVKLSDYLTLLEGFMACFVRNATRANVGPKLQEINKNPSTCCHGRPRGSTGRRLGSSQEDGFHKEGRRTIRAEVSSHTWTSLIVFVYILQGSVLTTKQLQRGG